MSLTQYKKAFYDKQILEENFNMKKKTSDFVVAFCMGAACWMCADEVLAPERSTLKTAYGIDIRELFKNNATLGVDTIKMPQKQEKLEYR